MSISFNFDENDFKKKMYAAAEKEAKEKIIEKVRSVGRNVKVTFTGSLENNSMKINLSGPDNEVAAAQKVLKD